MISSRSVILPFAAILMACCMIGVDAFYSPNEAPERFNQNLEAASYSGPLLQVRFETAPSAIHDYSALAAVRAVVYRLQGHVIDFTPFDRVLRGNYPTPGCRPLNNTRPQELTPACESECMNYGRYCQKYKNSALAQVAGSRLVEESARRTCIFKQLGYNGFFDYIYAMHNTTCDVQYTDECITTVYQLLKESLDVQELNACMGAMSPALDYENPLLDALTEEGKGVDTHLPSLFINGVGHDMRLTNDVLRDTYHALELICSSVPEEIEKPKVCGFCTDFCAKLNPKLPDHFRCLWELTCNDRQKTPFTDYLLHLAESNAIADQPGNPTTLPEQQQTEELEKETKSPEENLAEYSGSSSLNAPSSEQPQEQPQAAWFVVTIFFITAVGIAAASLVIIACLRQYRSKMIVDQYLKEQAAKKELGAMAHLDHAFFPDEVDLDVEPALQYSDHIDPSPAQHPPAKGAFLPKLT